MMDATEVAAALRGAAERCGGCVLAAIRTGSASCPVESCNECRVESAKWINDAADAIERCALPDGVEWPRFEDGGLVKFGDVIGVPDGAWMEHPVDQVLFTEDGNVEVFGDGNSVDFERGETAKRIVLAADGEPLKVGQTVWNINNGMEFNVSRLPKPGEYQAVEVRYRNGASTSFDPCQLTHQRPVLDADGNRIEPPMDVWWVCEGDEFGIHAERLHVDGIDGDGMVECRPFNGGTSVVLEPSELYVKRPALDADGVPIKKGDTVFRASDGREFEVTGIGGAFTIRVKDESMEIDVWTKPCEFAHTKPEPDTWERIEDDCTMPERDYYAKLVGHDVGLKDDAEIHEAVSRDIVRRCRALAERERGE